MDNNQNLNDQELVRREKLEKYKAFHVDPFGHAFKVTHSSEDIRKAFTKKSPASLERNKPYVTVAGRIKALRRMGIDTIQGFYYSKAVSIDDFQALLKENTFEGGNQK